MPGSKPPPDADRRLVGPAESDSSVSVTLYLRDRAPGESDEAATPMTREEYAERHGARDEDLRAVERFAKEYGLTIEEVHPAARRVRLSGEVAQMNVAFGIQSQIYESKEGSYRSHDGPVTLPPELAGAIEAVLGLDTRPVARQPH